MSEQLFNTVVTMFDEVCACDGLDVAHLLAETTLAATLHFIPIAAGAEASRKALKDGADALETSIAIEKPGAVTWH
jgi:hypothetical protein